MPTDRSAGERGRIGQRVATGRTSLVEVLLTQTLVGPLRTWLPGAACQPGYAGGSCVPLGQMDAQIGELLLRLRCPAAVRNGTRGARM